MKIIASLTTIPSRIEHIQATLESIITQNVLVNAIELNIPHIFEKTGETYTIPDWLLELVKSSKNTQCEVRIFRTDDYGTITKIAPTIFRYMGDNDVLIWSVNDNFKYPINTLSALLYSYKPSKRYVLSHSCGNWIYDKSTGGCIDYTASRDEGLHDFLEGFATVLYPAYFFLDDFEDYITITGQVPDNRNSDDVIMSNYLALKDIKVYNCKLKLNSVYSLAELNRMSYGLSSDAPLYALQQLKYEQHMRYVRVFNWLKSEEINGWLKTKIDTHIRTLIGEEARLRYI